MLDACHLVRVVSGIFIGFFQLSWRDFAKNEPARSVWGTPWLCA